MRQLVTISALFCFLLLSSCAKKDTAGPHATVIMKDGSAVAGTVVASSATEITLDGDDKTSHTIPMTQVRSIEYDDAPESAAASNGPATQPSTQPATSGQPATSTKPTKQPVHRDHYHPPESAVNTRTYELPVGTQIPVRAEETIDSKRASEGQTYAAEVAGDVLDADGKVVIPEGSNAKIVIKSASHGGKISGASDLVLDLRAISVDGQEYLIGTSDLKKQGRDGVGANKRTAIFTGGGAAIGAIIGAVAGGGKGAAIGAASGAGAGAVTQIVTKGDAIKVPAETVLTFKLDRTLRVDASK
jgi:hypothetical protein